MKEYRENKGYRALLNAALLTGIGNSLFNIVFVIYASTLPFKILAVSLASMATLIPNLLQILTGHLADRTKNKTRWMIGSSLVQFSLFLLLALVIQLPASMGLFLALLAINILSDCFGAYSSGLQLPFLQRLVAPAFLDQAMSFQMATQTIVQIIFQGIGAWAIVLLNNNFSLFGILNAFTFLLASLVIFQQKKLFLTNETQGAKKVFSFKENFLVTLKVFWKNPFLKNIIIFAFFINILSSSTTGLINIQLLDIVSLWFANYGNTVALTGMALSIGMIVGALWAKDWFKNTSLLQLIAYTAFLLSLLAGNFLMFKNRWLMVVLLFGVGYLMGKINPRFSAYLIREIDEDRLAISSGVFSTIVMLGGPIGQFFFLGIANRIFITLSWQIYFLCAFAVGGVALWFAITENSIPTTKKEV